MVNEGDGGLSGLGMGFDCGSLGRSTSGLRFVVGLVMMSGESILLKTNANCTAAFHKSLIPVKSKDGPHG